MATPEDNLVAATVFMGLIAFFLIAIYIYLLFKKRKRLNLAKEKD